MDVYKQFDFLARYQSEHGNLFTDEFDDLVSSLLGTLSLIINAGPDIRLLEADRVAWSRQTFPDATAKGCLEHARMEITEIEEALRQGLPVPAEYADAIMLLLDSAARAGIDCRQVLQAYKDKIEVNKKRNWQKDGDGRYKHVEEEIGPVKGMRELLEKYPDVDGPTWQKLIYQLLSGPTL